jgi:mono/diheme cytochrome c family protein
MVGGCGVRICALIVALLSLGATSAQAAEIELPAGPNRALVYGQCRTCHDLQYLVDSAGIPADAWGDILDSMGQYGWRPSAEDRAKLLDYLGTYLGPKPPPATQASTTTKSPMADSEMLFKEQCSVCHQPNGQGVAGQFPPLAGNRDLFLDRTFPALVVLFGLEGKVEVGGKTYEAAMPPFGHLSNDEVAALVRYVRNAWGNDKLRPGNIAPIDAKAVEALRKPELTPQKVWARRSKP